MICRFTKSIFLTSVVAELAHCCRIIPSMTRPQHFCLQELFGSVDDVRDETERRLRAHIADLEVNTPSISLVPLISLFACVHAYDSVRACVCVFLPFLAR